MESLPFPSCCELARAMSLLPVLAHGEDLDHADKDVDKVKLKADALVDNVPPGEAVLRQACVVQDLLDIVEGEATKNGKTTIQPKVLGPHQSAGSGGREDQGSKARESDNSHTCKEGTAEVQVLLLLGSGADEGNRSHHSDGVKTGAGEKSGLDEQERRQQSRLGDVEGSPHAIFDDVAAKVSTFHS